MDWVGTIKLIILIWHSRENLPTAIQEHIKDRGEAQNPALINIIHYMYVAQETISKNSKKHTEGKCHLLFHSACRS